MGEISNTLRFVLNDDDIEIGELSATETLLDYLRLTKRLRGSKEGCAEGDCGACTVLVGRLQGGELSYSTVNACICFVGMLHGTHVVTIEHLSPANGPLRVIPGTHRLGMLADEQVEQLAREQTAVVAKRRQAITEALLCLRRGRQAQSKRAR